MLTMTNPKEEEEVWAECSDEEMYNPGKAHKGAWEPKAEDMIKLFEELESKKVLELSWKCPGRRPPDSEVQREEEIKEELVETPSKQEAKRPVIPNEFDFDDDFPDTKTVLTPRRTPGSAPKPQKKVAKMDKVLKDMMQQRKLQAAEREARKLAKSPRGAPSSPSRARLGSPAGSPRTPPTSHGNRHSPARIGGGGDTIMNTPLRAPMDPNTPLRTPMDTNTPLRAPMDTNTPLRAPIDSNTPLRAPLELENARKTPTNESVNAGLNLVARPGETNTVLSNSGRLTPSRQSVPPGGFPYRPPSRETTQSPQSREFIGVNNSMSPVTNQPIQPKDNGVTTASSESNSNAGIEQKQTSQEGMDTS